MVVIGSQDRVFILTGAGISAESGIATFRDPDGMWRKWNPEKVATPEAWQRNPRLVWQFYSERRQQAAGVQPNAAHRALAQLEDALGDRMLVCTQNVDSLHELAGSKRVTHMHGELMKSRCDRCSRPPFHDEKTYFDDVAMCPCGGLIRPHVCWFGEMPYELDETLDWLEKATLFITIGSSGTVEPAASFCLWAGRQTPGRRARTFYIGAEEPANSMFFDEVFVGKAGELVPKIFELREKVKS